MSIEDLGLYERSATCSAVESLHSGAFFEKYIGPSRFMWHMCSRILRIASSEAPLA